ncbi:MAG: rhamnogalacturonan acetylesterase [Bacteroidia bacterium]|nr:rhamnogalacturonan acetylesterase [Bacteroidia bacterium]
MMRYTLLFLAAFFLTAGTAVEKKAKAVVYLIGDSTVKNGSGKGDGGLWGWGDYLYTQIDTNKIAIKNFARGGTSSRTYIDLGLWDNVFSRLKPGDYVIMQFGHNDGGPVNDNFRARGTIKGNGEETEEIDNILTKKHEIVHSYGWYMRKYITDTRSKGATPIVCSLVPRNTWENGKVGRSSNDYAKWAEEAATGEKAFYINLNERIARKYESIGEDVVKTKYFGADHTHTLKDGAILNASVVAEGIKSLKGCKLKKYIQ